MARKTYIQMRQEHDDRKAKLAEDDAKIKLAERKARNHKLFEVGGLVEKAGLINLEANVLYGALLSLKEDAEKTDIIEKWGALGGRSFAREARLRDEGKEPIVLTYPAPLAKEATTALRKAGFRFSKIFQHWEGLAKPDEAEALALTHGGNARRINASNPLEPTKKALPGKEGSTSEANDLLSRTRTA